MDILTHIKQLVVRGAIRYTEKARDEMSLDGLSRPDVVESILNARRIEKTIRSRSAARRYPGEKLYVIKGKTYPGTTIYTKGTITQEDGREVFYIIISAKVSTD